MSSGTLTTVLSDPAGIGPVGAVGVAALLSGRNSAEQWSVVRSRPRRKICSPSAAHDR